MLAYSAIAHAGYLLAAFAGTSDPNGLSQSGIAAAAFYIAAYAAMNVGIFAVVTLVAGYDEQLSLIDDYRGLVYRSPILGSLLIFFLLSLIGIPFTGGFFGKFYSFTAAVGGGAIWLAVIGLLNSGLAAAYYLRLVVVAAQRPAPDPNIDQDGGQRITYPKPAVGAAVIAALFLAVAATLVLGIIPGATLDAAQSAAHTLQAPPQAAVPAVPLQFPQ
jgi:NADH-quinone oxidoreductase subunit N